MFVVIPLGTPGFIAPEIAYQVGAQTVADMYSLGMTTCAYLFGEPDSEFWHEFFMGKLKDIKNKNLRELLEQMIEQKPEKRISSTEGLKKISIEL